MRIYISGPMTGKPDLNEPLFRSTAERLRGMGHVVFNPCDLPKALSALSYRDAIKADMAWICEHADAVVVLPGWTDSPGARAEVALARSHRNTDNFCDVYDVPEVTRKAAPTEPVTNMFGDCGTMEEDFGR